jgi:hypothetical protein
MLKTGILAVICSMAAICCGVGSAVAQDEAVFTAIKAAPQFATCRKKRKDDENDVFLVFQLAAYDSSGKRYYRVHTNPPIELIVAADGTVSGQPNPCASDVVFLKR